MINSKTLSDSDAREIESCVRQHAADSFDGALGRLMDYYAHYFDEQTADEAVVTWLAYALYCFLNPEGKQ